MGSIKVKLACGCIVQSHTDDLLDRNWTWEQIMAASKAADEDIKNGTAKYGEGIFP